MEDRIKPNINGSLLQGWEMSPKVKSAGRQIPPFPPLYQRGVGGILRIPKPDGVFFYETLRLIINY
jgi:hypothetical protein